MKKEAKKQKYNLKDYKTYDLTEEQKKLIEKSKEVKVKNSVYYGSKGSPCCSKDTKIMTQYGEVSISDINVGDIVLSSGGVLVSVIQINKIPVLNHNVLSISLSDGTILEISPEHPTADGRIFSNLKVGDLIDGRTVKSVELVPYKYSHTYDILPDSPTSTYYANGVLIGSTLVRENRLESFLNLALKSAG